MKPDLLDSLDWLGHWALVVGASLFALASALFLGAVLVTRDRRVVNRWTPRWLATGLTALAVGAGGPLVAGLLKVAVRALPDALFAGPSVIK